MNEKKTVLNQIENKCKNNTSIFTSIFSENLKELRQEKQLSQKQIAKKLDIAVSTYANWEQGRREPCIYDIFNLIFAFEIEANDLFDIKTKECKNTISNPFNNVKNCNIHF